jgi:hypothetical protein
MKSHHTKEKGDLAVLKVQADLCEQGFIICVPQTEHAPFDLVVYRSNKLWTVQVKYCSVRDGTLKIDIESTWANSKGSHRMKYVDGDFDILAVYCPETKECYYIPWEEMPPKKSAITLRIEDRKNKNYRSQARMAVNYKTFSVSE